jgi:prephenate dehydrogenase
MRLGTLTIVGVGLIGGSIGLAAKKKGLAETVIGVGRQQATLERARTLGAIDVCLDLAGAVRQADVAVFCTPVDVIASQVVAAAKTCSTRTLLTDAGSTKEAILCDVERLMPQGITFVGSHPLAGSEKHGPEHADANLFENRVTIVTPTERTSEAAIERTVAFWTALGSRVKIMHPSAHDQAVAVTSHVPHLMAAVLASALPDTLRDLAAGGFRDTTRVAAGDPAIWTGIFEQNCGAVAQALERLDAEMSRFRQALANRDWSALRQLLTQAKKVRDALGS